MSTKPEPSDTPAATPAEAPEGQARRQLLKGSAMAGIAGASVVGIGRKAHANWPRTGGSAGASAGHS